MSALKFFITLFSYLCYLISGICWLSFSHTIWDRLCFLVWVVFFWNLKTLYDSLRLWILCKPSIYLAFSDIVPAREGVGITSLFPTGGKSPDSLLGFHWYLRGGSLLLWWEFQFPTWSSVALQWKLELGNGECPNFLLCLFWYLQLEGERALHCCQARVDIQVPYMVC